MLQIEDFIKILFVRSDRASRIVLPSRITDATCAFSTAWRFLRQRNFTTTLNPNSTYDRNRTPCASLFITLPVAWSIRLRASSRRTETFCRPRSFNWCDNRNTIWFVTCSNARSRKLVTYTQHCRKMTRGNRTQIRIRRYVGSIFLCICMYVCIY